MGHLERLMQKCMLVPANSDVILASPYTSWKVRIRLDPVASSNAALRFETLLKIFPGSLEACIVKLAIESPQTRNVIRVPKQYIRFGDIMLISIDGIAQRPLAGFPPMPFTKRIFGDHKKSTLLSDDRGELEEFRKRKSFHFRFEKVK